MPLLLLPPGDSSASGAVPNGGSTALANTWTAWKAFASGSLVDIQAASADWTGTTVTVQRSYAADGSGAVDVYAADEDLPSVTNEPKQYQVGGRTTWLRIGVKTAQMGSTAVSFGLYGRSPP